MENKNSHIHKILDLYAQYIKDVSALEKNYIAKFAYVIYLNMVKRRTFSKQYDQNYDDVTDSTTCALLVLHTFIYAIRADDKFDEQERESFCTIWSTLFPNVDIRGSVVRMLTEQVDVQIFKQYIKFKEEALDLYLLSSLILHTPNFIEKSYLDLLSSTLAISPSLKKELDNETEDLYDVLSKKRHIDQTNS